MARGGARDRRARRRTRCWARSARDLSRDAAPGARWLLREPGSGTREAVEQALQPHLHHLREALQLGGTEAIKQAAAAGLGVTCLSRLRWPTWSRWARLRILDTPLPPLSRQLWVVHHPGKQVPPALAALLGLPPDAFASG